LSNVSANTAFAILKMNMYWLVDLGRLKLGRVAAALDAMVLTGGAEELAAIQ
jgi:hypothetical protein